MRSSLSPHFHHKLPPAPPSLPHSLPPGNIHKDSPAAKFLSERGVVRKDFNSYGSRRGNDEIMARGTFANIRIVNKFLGGEVGPSTVFVPTKEKMYIYDAAMVSGGEGGGRKGGGGGIIEVYGKPCDKPLASIHLVGMFHIQWDRYSTHYDCMYFPLHS